MKFRASSRHRLVFVLQGPRRPWWLPPALVCGGLVVGGGRAFDVGEFVGWGGCVVDRPGGGRCRRGVVAVARGRVATLPALCQGRSLGGLPALRVPPGRVGERAVPGVRGGPGQTPTDALAPSVRVVLTAPRAEKYAEVRRSRRGRRDRTLNAKIAKDAKSPWRDIDPLPESSSSPSVIYRVRTKMSGRYLRSLRVLRANTPCLFSASSA